MRYLPNTGMIAVTRFNPDKRPPSSALPDALNSLLAERDQLAESGRLALIAVRDLEDEALDLAAKAKDDAAATGAARAGRAIPKPSAVPKLENDRAEAARNLAAQETAFKSVIDEASDLVYALRDDSPTAAAADKAKAAARAAIDKLVDRLATAIETAVAAGAARDWVECGRYHTPAMTWPVDVVPALASHGLSHSNTSPIHVRSVLTGAANAVLEDQDVN
jgi:hypothetical protein